MKDVLKTLYKDKIIETINEYDFVNYHYFIDDKQVIFGILKSALSDNEQQLIESIYSRIDETFIPHHQMKILAYLNGQNKEGIDLPYLKYYFVRIFTPLEGEMNEELIHLLKDSFDHEVIISQQKNLTIIITKDKQEFNFFSFLKTIESDFMIKLLGFESDYYEPNESLPGIFQFDLNNILSEPYHKDILVSKSQLVRQYLFKQIGDHDKATIKSYMLHAFQTDHEMLQLIKVYFESNLNTSLAAKLCYMHRNTFINKLDKFSLETNFNLRNYDDAFMVYLAINL